MQRKRIGERRNNSWDSTYLNILRNLRRWKNNEKLLRNTLHRTVRRGKCIKRCKCVAINSLISFAFGSVSEKVRTHRNKRSRTKLRISSPANPNAISLFCVLREKLLFLSSGMLVAATDAWMSSWNGWMSNGVSPPAADLTPDNLWRSEI